MAPREGDVKSQPSERVPCGRGVRRVRQWFLCVLALCHVAAFSSLYLQWPGLYGEAGIMPAHQAKPEGFSLKTLAAISGLSLLQTAELVCLTGTLLGVCLVGFPAARISPAFALLGVLYFSLYQVGRKFLWFQWDIILLETTALSLIVAPLFPTKHSEPHDRVTLWPIRWLAFRLMFASGVVKLTSGCPTWWGLTAMQWHYESQCIPTPLAWYFHQAPLCWHRLEVIGTYLVEIAYPFLFFAPVSALRALGVYAQIMLMGAIALTGNYNFFSLITCGLVLASLDDSTLPSAASLVRFLSPVTSGGLGLVYALIKLPLTILKSLFSLPYRTFNYAFSSKAGAQSTLSVLGLLAGTCWIFRVLLGVGVEGACAHLSFARPELLWFLEHAVPGAVVLGLTSLLWNVADALWDTLSSNKTRLRKTGELVQTTVVSCVVLSLFAVSLVPFTELDRDTQNKIPLSVQELYHRTRQYHVANSYGLFRSMTGVGGRPEVVLEASERHDGGWQEYEFLYKPGDLSRPPPVVAPHQPRLDWQMWFAALGSYEHNPWIISLANRLLSNSTDVLKLLKHNPFPEAPPKFIRASKYRYHYTKWGGESRDWWTRDSQEEYFPPLALYQPTLKEFLDHHGYSTPLKEQPTSHLPILEIIRGICDMVDPTVIIWTLCLAAFLPQFKSLRFRFSLFGI